MFYGSHEGIQTLFWSQLFGVQEAALPLTTSYSALRSHIDKALLEKLGVTDRWTSNGPWINDIFSSYVVYSMGNETFKLKYTSTEGAAGSDPAIKLSGDPIKVHVAYVDSKTQAAEAYRLIFDTPASLEENRKIYESIFDQNGVKKRNDYAFEGQKRVKEGVTLEIDAQEAGKTTSLKKIPVKIIAPGWGSSAYYSKKVLQEAATNGVFKAGTHMYWNHATATEEADRPEGDLNNLAAVLTSGAKWDDNGPKGPGLYAEAKIFSDYAAQVEEKGAHIGVSINAGIKAHEGEAEGKKGLIADQFVYGYSTDFVTRAGAGGAPVVPAMESDRRNNPTQEASMTPEEIKALQDENTRLKNENTAREAEDKRNKTRALAVTAVTEALKGASVTLSTKAIERLCENPTMTADGKVDSKWVEGVVADMTEGLEGGKVTGMGAPKPNTTGKEANKPLTDAEEKEFKETFKSLGVPEKGLDIVVKGGR